MRDRATRLLLSALLLLCSHSAAADEDRSSVEVLVALPDGEPVGGAELWAYDRAGFEAPPWDAVTTGVTDEDGRAVLRLPAGGYVLRGSHATYCVRRQVFRAPTDQVVRPRLVGGWPTVIEVLDEDLAPLSGIDVWEASGGTGRVARTNVEGRADLGLVWYGTREFALTAPGRRQVGISFTRYPAAEPRIGWLRTRTVPPAARSRVRVVEADGSPVAGALVRDGLDGDLRTDAVGWVTVRARDRGPTAPVRAFAPDGRRARAVAGGDPSILVLEPGRTVRGRTIDDATGEPVGGAHVVSHRRGGAALATRSDDQGWFELERVTAERLPYVVAVSAERVSRARYFSFPPPVEDGDVLVRMQPHARLTGRVIDERGRPVADVEVAARSVVTQVEWLPTTEPSRTGTDGRFSIPVAPRLRTPTLVVRHETHTDVLVLPTPRRSGVVDDTIDVGDMVSPVGFRFHARVVDAGGRGVPVARLTIAADGPLRSGPVGDRDVVEGAFYDAVHVPASRARIEVVAPGYPKRTFFATADTRTLVLRRPGAFTARLLRRGGAPLADATGTLEMWTETKERWVTVRDVSTSADAELRLEGLRRGRFRLRFAGFEVHEFRLDEEHAELGDVRLTPRSE